MIQDEISEYPYSGTIERVIKGKGMQSDTIMTIYEGVMDEHMATDEEGNVMQTASYIVSIPLTKDKEDKWIVPQKGDKISLSRYGDELKMTVDNADPSQLGGVSIYATRSSW